MQCANAILSPVACPALQYISTLFHNRHDFRRKNTEGKMSALIVSINMAETFFIPKRNWRDMIQNVHWSSRKVSVILVRF